VSDSRGAERAEPGQLDGDLAGDPSWSPRPANAANERIADTLDTQDADQDPGEEGDGDSAPAA
jgi:hypothetical protein